MDGVAGVWVEFKGVDILEKPDNDLIIQNDLIDTHISPADIQLVDNNPPMPPLHDFTGHVTDTFASVHATKDDGYDESSIRNL